ncbi:MAG: dephospho-CoA kinase [Pseudonocardiales bacterium]|nr:MAG: dephospho-CoA kinase [Pseudonocardiales bacterium]
MLRIGLTGGIGSGKSVVAALLAERGALVIDADRVAREVVEPGTPGLSAVVAAFGPKVLAADGSLDRARLASLVFADPAARQRLNAVVHPLVAARTAELTAAAPLAAVVVHDVPLLTENGLAPRYHLVVVVEAPESVRIARLVGTRGMTGDEARSRVAAQATDEQRRAVADVVLANDGTVDEITARVDGLWRQRIEPYADNLHRHRVSRSAGVAIVAYDPSWPQEYARLADRLRLATGGLRVDHVGSTSVPGLAAKDVIDVQVTVGTIEQADDLRSVMEEAGFPAVPDNRFDTPKAVDPDPAHWAKRFHGSADPGRPAHVHVRVAGSAGWRYALLFRDWLRADPAEAATYGQAKRNLAAAHPLRADYTEAKEPWFDAVLPRAERWAHERGWHPR